MTQNHPFLSRAAVFKGSFCQPNIPCDPACPAGYRCEPTGVCTNGSPSSLVIDVKTFAVSGKVTLNGAAPLLGADCPSYPSAATSTLLFTDSVKGYVTTMNTVCRDNTFSFSGQLYPGTYLVRINGNTPPQQNLWVNSGSGRRPSVW